MFRLLFILFAFLALGATAEAADAKKRLHVQCELGTDDGLSCWELGNMAFERGDWKGAQQYFGKACIHRWYSGCHNAGVAAQRLGDVKAAKNLWSRACTHNHLASCSALAFVLWAEKDVEQASNLAQKACAEYGEACYLRGVIAMSTQRQKAVDKEEALDFFKRGCAREYLMACYKGGQLSQELHHSSGEAISLYEKSCTLAHARSCVNLSEIYIFEGNTVRAREVLVDVCQFYSNGDACVALGNLEEKVGNLPAAARAYKRACDVPYSPACYAWAQLEVSRGNMPRAQRLLKKACDVGYQKACRELAEQKKGGNRRQPSTQRR